MARTKKPGEITIFEGRKGGGSRRAGRVSSCRRGGKFSASFEADRKWVIPLDSRDLSAIVGTAVYGHLKRSVAADVDPETVPRPLGGEFEIARADGSQLAPERAAPLRARTRWPVRWGNREAAR